MGGDGALERGRRAFAERRWGDAYGALSDAARTEPLTPADLELLATASYLVGREDDAVASWRRAHHAFVQRGEAERAARIGFWLSFHLLLQGDVARSAGWLARAQRLLEPRGPTCAEQGYVTLLLGLRAMGQGDAAGSSARFDEAIALANRFDDPDLLALGLLGRGQAAVQARELARGVTLLDEAMVGVTSGEVSPIAAGIVYCAVVLTCQRIFDLRRAREWTTALDEWCASQPDLVPFRGDCLVRRSEILQLEGEWDGALQAATQACERLADRTDRLVGLAFYQRGEIHRLRGDDERAEEMYREAARRGHEPQPGVSLLRRSQGQLDAAVAAIRRVEAEARTMQGPGAGTPRPLVLGPFVEIMLAASDLEAARAAARELTEIAADGDVPFLRATSRQAEGAVLLAGGDPQAALPALREAWTTWQQLEAPYESARVRVLIGVACRQLGDEDTARIHLDAARNVLERLGAAPDLARLDDTEGDTEGDTDGAVPETVARLTAREREVLALAASGATNRQIAKKLFISEHTVARHMSNIFDKLGVGSRTAASAIAFEHGLVPRGRGQF